MKWGMDYSVGLTDEFEKIIKAIFHFANKEESRENFYQIRYDKEDLYNKLYDGSDNLITNKFYKENQQDYKNFITSIFHNVKDFPLFESDFIRFIRDSSYREFILLDGELEDIAINYFDIYAKSIKSFDDSTYWHFFIILIKK